MVPRAAVGKDDGRAEAKIAALFESVLALLGVLAASLAMPMAVNLGWYVVRGFRLSMAPSAPPSPSFRSG